jgi:single-stranded-DNA-specific exonuclease
MNPAPTIKPVPLDVQLDIAPAPPKEKVDRILSQVDGLHPICAAIMVQRGLDSYEAARSFFAPDLEAYLGLAPLADAPLAAQRLADAVAKGELITLYGDYDVDGTCAVAVMQRFLTAIGAKVRTYQPDRYTEGYGVSEKGVREAARHGSKLMITLDCGILAHDCVSLANELGMDVVVCDHHLPGATLPSALAVLNPKRTDCTFPGAELCGCGVAWMLLHELADLPGFMAHRRGEMRQLLMNQLPLVAVASCCDIVPLTGINRALVSKGLTMLQASPPEGIAAMLRLAAHSGPVEVSDVVFKLGPRINAAGRLEHASIALELLTTTDPVRMESLAARLEALNHTRKTLDAAITTEAAAQMLDGDPELTRFTTVVFGESWHKGVIGIIASRLTEICYRPTVVLTQTGDVLTGSGRSVDGFNLHAAIEACSDTLIQFGGHDAAAGLTLYRHQLDAFAERFEAAVARAMPHLDRRPRLTADLAVRLSDWYNEHWVRFYKQLSRMRPFGPYNPEPVFVTRRCKAYMAQVVGGDHLRFSVHHPVNERETLPVIAFKMARHYDLVASGVPFTLAYVIGEKEWNGRRSIQLEAKAIQPDC